MLDAVVGIFRIRWLCPPCHGGTRRLRIRLGGLRWRDRDADGTPLSGPLSIKLTDTLRKSSRTRLPPLRDREGCQEAADYAVAAKQQATRVQLAAELATSRAECGRLADWRKLLTEGTARRLRTLRRQGKKSAAGLAEDRPCRVLSTKVLRVYAAIRPVDAEPPVAMKPRLTAQQTCRWSRVTPASACYSNCWNQTRVAPPSEWSSKGAGRAG